MQSIDVQNQDSQSYPETLTNGVEHPAPIPIQNSVGSTILENTNDGGNIESFPAIKPLELPESITQIQTQEYHPIPSFQQNEIESIAEPVKTEQVEIKSETLPTNELPPNFPIREPSEMRTSTGELYVPVVALEPLNLDELLKPIVVHTSQNNNAEIKQDKIKESLKEIISDLDTFVEKDKELKDSLQGEELRKQINSDDNKENFERQRQVSRSNSNNSNEGLYLNR